MNSDLELTEKRIMELAHRAWERGYPCYTDFLGLSEQTALNKLRRQFPPVKAVLYGGVPGCERVIAGFGEYVDDSSFPIKCVKINPAGMKFAEELSHRDVLGALMNLGIKRELLGDIIVHDKEAWMFCAEKISDYICENLIKIRHTTVKCEITERVPEGELFRTEPKIIQLSSERIDAIIAHAWNMSRSNAQELFTSGKVFLDGAECENPDTTPVSGQIISVRGIGRLKYMGYESHSRKGKLNARVEMFF